MISVSDLEIGDLLKLEQMHNRDFPFPNVTDCSYISKKVLLRDNEVVGAIFARLTSELVLIMDPNISNFTRARLWKEAAGEVMRDLLSRGIKSTHVFITPESDDKYVKMLEKKFGFVKATGIPLYLEVE